MKKKAATRKVNLTPVTLLRISLGVFFILLGLMGVLPTVEESVFSLTNTFLYLEVVFGIVEIACGVFIIASMFTFFTRKIKYTMSVLILVFWAARIILSKLVWGFAITSSGIWFKPDFGAWLLILSCELIIATCLWINVKAYES
ncbi:MAG: hypothetical protein JW822_14510 [Spirochaetales bacterium]|nr:hypothetical protein [Spirochaetales bacterium]